MYMYMHESLLFLQNLFAGSRNWHAIDIYIYCIYTCFTSKIVHFHILPIINVTTQD